MAELERLAVVVGDENHRAQAEAEARARVFIELHAAEYLERLQRGEMGAAAFYLGDLRRGSEVDPWRLVVAVAARALAVRDVAAVPGQAGAGTEPAQAAVPAAVTEREGHG